MRHDDVFGGDLDVHRVPGVVLLEAGKSLLGDHEFGVCVHGDGFGTRSSSLIALAADGTATYRFADGPPCRTGYEAIDTRS